MDPETAKEKNCCNRQAGTAFKYTIAFFIALIILIVILYSVINQVDLPVERHAQSVLMVGPVGGHYANSRTYPLCGDPGIPPTQCVNSRFHWKFAVTFPVYVIALLSWLGWFFFTLFAGIGLMALPVDLINEFRTRPTPMKTAQYFEEKKKLGERAAMLIELGEKIKMTVRQPDRTRKERKEDSTNLKKFETHYYYLKQDYKILNTAHALKGGNPLVPFAKLIAGVLGIGISLSWFLHICIFILPNPPAHQFLNLFFIKMSSVAHGQFPLFGVCAYAIWSLYLLWAVVKGNFKMGIRFFFWKIYPMEVNNTLMNAFLANTWVIMLCAIPTVQFCARAFPVYARDTSVDMLFGTQAQNLEWFKYWWQNNVFIYIIVILNGITALYLIFAPNDKAANIEKILAEMAREDPRQSS